MFARFAAPSRRTASSRSRARNFSEGRVARTALSHAALLGGVLALGCAGSDRDATLTDATQDQAPDSASLPEICTEASRSWDLFDTQGQPIGRTSGQCLGKDGRHYRVMVQRHDASGALVEEYHLMLSEKGRPYQATLRTPYFHTSYLWRDESITSIRLGDQATVEVAGRPWLFPADAIYLRELSVRMAPVAAPTVAREGLKLTEIETLSPKVHAHQLVYRAGSSGSWTLEDDTLTVQLSGDSLRQARVLDVTDRANGFVARERAERGSLRSGIAEQLRPHYTTPSTFQVLPIRVQGEGEDPTLAGELVLANDNDARPRPGVLFLSGSGPQDRNGFVPNSSIDIGSHEIHDALVQAGFAVLRFDDRGTGASEIGGTATPGYREFVKDASRALVALASQPQVDPNQLFVIGHSEGAITAVLLAKDKVVVRGVPGRKGPYKLRGIITLALPSRNIADVILGQVRALTPKDDPALLEKSLAETEAMFAAIRKGDELPAQAEPMRPYLYDLMAVEPLAEVKRLKVPMLALQGAKDFQVDPVADFEPVADVLRSRKDKSDAILFDGLDHLMKFERGDSSVGHYSDLRRNVDVGVINAVVTWCNSLAPQR